MKVLVTMETTEVREEVWETIIDEFNLQKFHNLVCISPDLMWKEDEKVCTEPIQIDSCVIDERSFSKALKYKIIL